MSLRSKSLDKLKYVDVVDFCSLQVPEGTRLDYKYKVPNHVADLVAAFGNHLGGLCLFGVDANKATNCPNLPVAGMPATVGIGERIIQKCRDNIYPPIQPEIAVLPLPGSSRLLVVVRVAESPEAPHATHDGRRVYVRTADVNTPIDLARIDRIEQLLSRRDRYELERETLIDRELARAAIGGVAMWCSVIPLFPWRPLVTPENCRKLHRQWYLAGESIQTAPGGTIAIEGHCYSSVGLQGHVFILDRDIMIKREVLDNSQMVIPFLPRCQSIRRTLAFAKKFYESEGVEQAGYLQCSVGFERVKGHRMLRRPRSWESDQGSPFPDERARIDTRMSLQQLLEADLTSPTPGDIESLLFKQIAFAFDRDYPWLAKEFLIE